MFSSKKEILRWLNEFSNESNIILGSYLSKNGFVKVSEEFLFDRSYCVKYSNKDISIEIEQSTNITDYPNYFNLVFRYKDGSFSTLQGLINNEDICTTITDFNNPKDFLLFIVDSLDKYFVSKIDSK
jgi:hypothetical protein